MLSCNSTFEAALLRPVHLIARDIEGHSQPVNLVALLQHLAAECFARVPENHDRVGNRD